MMLVVASVLALAPTAVMVLFLIVFLGSAQSINVLFSMDITVNRLMILAVAYLLYYFTVDTIIEMMVKYIAEDGAIYYVIVCFIRMISFHFIGIVIGLSATTSPIIAIGLALIIAAIKFLYWSKTKSMGVQMKQ